MPTGSSAGTIPELFWKQVARSGDRAALRKKDFGIWQETTWREYGEHVRATAYGLMALGLEPGDRVAILSEGRPEWYYADLGAQSAGGVVAGIYATMPAEQAGYVVGHAEAKIWIVEDQEQYDKAVDARSNLPSLRWIVVMDPRGLRDVADPSLLTFAELQERGRELAAADPELFDQRMAGLSPDDTAILFYTSGTTGTPKAVMHSHESFLAGLDIVDRLYDTTASDEVLCHLPLCHLSGRVWLVLSILVGYTVNFAESPQTVFRDLKEVAPTAFFGVPRTWEKLKSTIEIGIGEATWTKRATYALCVAAGRQKARFTLSGQRPPFPLRVLSGLADLLVFRKLRKRIGMDRAGWVGVSAAPIAPEVLFYFEAIGLTVLEGYGQTETGVTVWTREDEVRPGKAGRVLPGIEYRVAEDGELVWRSPGMMQGYFRDPELTAETLQDGWFRSGDVGTIDEDGFMTHTGRTKDILVTSAGRNVYPQAIENVLKASDYIVDAVVTGENRPYLTALIVLDEETASHYAQTHGVPFSTLADLAGRPEIVRLIEAAVQQVNRRWSDREQIQDFRVLKWELSDQDEELTPTMKVRRAYICERYAELIDEMYR